MMVGLVRFVLFRVGFSDERVVVIMWFLGWDVFLMMVIGVLVWVLCISRWF